MNTSLVKAVGGWDSDTDGAQDWDLFLKLLAKSDKVAHIPKILYHWRVIASSTAHSIETKPYALAGQRRAIDKYLNITQISAEAFHQKTELFLKWQEKAIDDSPLVFIEYSSMANLHRAIRQLKRLTEQSRTVIIVRSEFKSQYKASKAIGETIYYESGQQAASVAAYIKSMSQADRPKVTLFLTDKIKLPTKHNWYADLIGWLNIKEVAAVSGRLVDKKGLIVESGGIITPDFKYAPIFRGFPRFYQSYLGNAEWVRNLTVLQPYLCATKTNLILEFEKSEPKNCTDIINYFLWASITKKYRLVMSPHVTATLATDYMPPIPKLPFAKKLMQSARLKYDPYSNPNMSKSDPLRLFEDESLAGLIEHQAHKAPTDRYQHDAIILAGTYDITSEDIKHNQDSTKRVLTNPKSVAWVLPAYDAVYAGLANIFSFADYLARQRGLQTTFYILKSETDVAQEKQLAVAAFPNLLEANFVAIRPDHAEQIQAHDIGIATQWATAYPLAKAESIGRKCYFIQDNETNFYPSGSISALVELTYRFGFMAIANTPGLLELYQQRYGGHGIVAKSLVRLDDYHPRQNRYYAPQKPYKVFFYARPNMPRNAFELGVAGLKRLKQDMGTDVEIITAGAAWEPSEYGVEGLFTNLGKLSYEAVPKLYRTVDAGLMFMFSGHPGVTASELMASGCPVVVNQYDDITWHELYQHEKTSLVTLPTASEIARNLRRCLEEPELRKHLIDSGLAKVTDFYAGYEASLNKAYDAIISGKAN